MLLDILIQFILIKAWKSTTWQQTKQLYGNVKKTFCTFIWNKCTYNIEYHWIINAELTKWFLACYNNIIISILIWNIPILKNLCDTKLLHQPNKKFLLRHECWANNKRGSTIMDDASFMTDYMLYIVVRARIMCVPKWE